MARVHKVSLTFTGSREFSGIFKTENKNRRCDDDKDGDK